MEMQRLDARWRSLDSSPRPSAAELRQYLKHVRDLRIRDSEAVVRWGAILLANYASSLPSEELWLVKEQVAIAAMDTPHTKLALQLVEQIRQQFPNSKRADRVTGMYNESQDRSDDAAEWYDKITDDQPSNPSALKRQVAMAAGSGDSAQAVKLLTSYLRLYSSDIAAWEELASMYLKASHYQQAAFCLEEALMLDAGNIRLHLLYAEVHYTIGGTTSLRVARRYFASALQLSDGTSPRALLGVAASTAALSSVKGARDEDSNGLASAAAETLIARYRQQDPAKLPIMRKWLQVQGLDDPK